MSRPATAKASKSYSCSCGCGEVIKTGQTVIVHMGDFYSPGHYVDKPEPIIEPVIFSHPKIEQEPEQLELQLF